MNTNWRPGQPIALETERFRIASIPPRATDATYLSWWNDPEVQKGLNMPPRNWTLQDAQRHVASFDNRRRFHLGIVDKAAGKLIGFISLFRENHGRVQTNSVIGDKDYWGQRVVFEVRERIIRFIFEEMDAYKITATVNARNLPSIYNYKAQGFTCEAILRDHAEWIEGGRVDMLQFGLLKPEWEDRQTGEEA